MRRAAAMVLWSALAMALLSGCGPAPAPGALRVMALGDSITEGSPRYPGYRPVLARLVQSSGYPVDFVGSSRWHRWCPPWPPGRLDLDHEGHWNWRIDQILARLPAWLDQANPDVVLLHLGTNDLFKGEPRAQVVAEWMAVLDLLYAHNPEVIVLAACLIPSVGMEEDFRQFNQALQAAWLRRTGPGPRVIWVDQFRGFDPGLHTWDGVHPNAAGAQKLAERWWAALREVLAARAS